MDSTERLFAPLLEKAEQYGKTSFELLKLKTLDKTADITSSIISRLLLVSIFLLSVLTITIGAALWLGELLGKNYYGFFLVASFYGLCGVILYFIRPVIKRRLNNSLIIQLLN